MKLLDYIENLQIHGQLWFEKKVAKESLNCTDLALNRSIDRLVKKKKVIILKPGFVFIIPVEYQSWGIVPADWFIDPLMEYLNIPYYIGLLTAASYYGAAHQKPQIFQVIVNKDVRKVTKKRVQVNFYNNSNVTAIPTKKIQVKTGYALISSPEATALDLVKYYRSCGYLSNVATVLAELKEEMHIEPLTELINKKLYDISVLQRFGFLMSLEEVGGSSLVENLADLIAQTNPRFIPLQPGIKYNYKERNKVWRLYINDEIEVDL